MFLKISLILLLNGFPKLIMYLIKICHAIINMTNTLSVYWSAPHMNGHELNFLMVPLVFKWSTDKTFMLPSQIFIR